MRGLGSIAAIVAAALLIGASGGAAAPQAARAGIFTGYGFEACTAPSLAALKAWSASPYRAVGIYLGGTNRACADGNLSAVVGLLDALARVEPPAAVRRPAGAVCRSVGAQEDLDDAGDGGRPGSRGGR